MLQDGDREAVLQGLLADGLKTQDAIALLRARLATAPDRIEAILTAETGLDEQELMTRIGKATGWSVRSELLVSDLDQTLITRHGLEFFSSRNLAPIVGSQDQPARLAVARPSDGTAIREAQFLLGLSNEIVLVPLTRLREALRQEKHQSNEVQPPAERLDFSASTSHEDSSRAARQLDQIISDAIELGASDIHFEAREAGLKIRLRVDGILRPYSRSSSDTDVALVARLKLLGGMSVTERRLPQDGSCRRTVFGRTIELRLSTVPTQFGESLVSRLLDPSTNRQSLGALGYEPDIARQITELIQRPNGLFVISGPTGSGKTTTLYAALQVLNDGRRKIVTAEDPIEQSLDGIDQIQVNPAIGLGFSQVLRAALRQDPNVLMIGEIRDTETAEIACRAALVGRLVLATIHASSAKAVRSRFINLGVPAYLIDEVMIGAISQKLVPNPCTKCESRGCDACSQTGFSGRRLYAEFC